MIQWFGDKLKQVIYSEVDKAADRTGRRMVTYAERIVSVRTGELQSKLFYRYDRSSKRLIFGDDAPHALVVEFGTYKMPPQPYIRPTLLAVGPTFFAPYSTEVRLGTTLPPNYTPRKIRPNVRPAIAAANAKLNRGVVARTKIDLHHHGLSSKGKKWASVRGASQLHRYRKAWN